QDFCSELLVRFGEPQEPGANFIMARACAAAPCDAVDPSRVVEWATKGTATERGACQIHAPRSVAVPLVAHSTTRDGSTASHGAAAHARAIMKFAPGSWGSPNRTSSSLQKSW